MVSQVDLTSFETEDYVRLMLQRSDILSDVRRPGRIIKAWVAGEEDDITQLAQQNGPVYAQRALSDILTEFEALMEAFGDWSPASVADIGCGIGIFGWYAIQVFNAKAYLIDIENSEARGFGYSDIDRGYCDLKKTQRFLTDNGIADDQFEILNPNDTDISQVGQVDLATSFLACGFHFPVETYMPFFENNVAPGGRIVLDIREAKEAEQVSQLETLGEVTVISRENKRARMMVTKPA